MEVETAVRQPQAKGPECTRRGKGQEVVAVHSGCHNKDTLAWVAYKQQTLIFHGSGGLLLPPERALRGDVTFLKAWLGGCVDGGCKGLVWRGREGRGLNQG